MIIILYLVGLVELGNKDPFDGPTKFKGSRKVVDGGGSRLFLMEYYVGGLCSAVTFYSLLTMMMVGTLVRKYLYILTKKLNMYFECYDFF